MKFYEKEFKKIRTRLRFSTHQLGRILNVSPSTISRWENKISAPNEKNIYLLAKAMNIHTSQISDIETESLNEEMEDLQTVMHQNEEQISRQEREVINFIKKQSQINANTKLIIDALIKNSESAIYIKNNQNNFIFANEKFYNLIEQPKISIINKNDSDVFPAKDALQNEKEDKQILNGEIHKIHAERTIQGTRKKRIGIIAKSPIKSSRGTIQGILCTITDITEQAELKELYKMVGHMIAKSEMLLSVIDIKTQKILYVNKGYVNLFRPVIDTSKYDESWDYWLNNVVHPDDREEQLKYLTENKFPKNRTYRIIHPEKGVRKMNAYISDPIIFHGRKCKITITRDVTNEINPFQ